MPNYDYRCDLGHVQEVFLTPQERDDGKEVECIDCGGLCERIWLKAPTVKPPGGVPHDRARDIWEDTPLAGTDGINPVTFVSDKVQVDGGNRFKTLHRKKRLPVGNEAGQMLHRQGFIA